MVETAGTSLEVLADLQAWALAQADLDRHLTCLLPGALVPLDPHGVRPATTLSDDDVRRVSALYGKAIGRWAHYVESRRLEREGPRLPADQQLE